VTESGARRRLRELRPLSAALRGAVPEVIPITVGGHWPGARLRLYQQVIGIRDAQLALRPYHDPAVHAAAVAAARTAGSTADDVAATIEAAALAAAIRAKKAGDPPKHVPRDAPIHGGANLAGETAWLTMASRAFASSPLVREPAHEGDGAAPPDHSASSDLGDRPHRR